MKKSSESSSQSHEISNTRPNLSVCNITKVLYSSKNTYLKSICYINKNSSTIAANDYCKSNNMQLYRITDIESHDAFYSFCKNLTKPQMIITNGYCQNFTDYEKANSLKWTLYSDKSVPFYFKSFVTQYGVYGVNESCAIFGPVPDYSELVTYTCYHDSIFDIFPFHFICEY